MKKLTIAIDIGDTLLDRSKGKKTPDGKDSLTYPMFSDAFQIVKKLKEAGHKIVIISKISHGDEQKIINYLTHHLIIPNLITRGDLEFCHERESKGPIAVRLGVDVIVDDRVQVHNIMAKCGVEHRILFLEGHDDRKNYTLETTVLEAVNWKDVLSHINNLSQ